MIVPEFPKLSETFIVSKFLAMARDGLDVHIVCAKSNEEQWKGFQKLEAENGIHNRIHVVWPHRPRWIAALLIPIAFLYCLLRNPAKTILYLIRGWGLFGHDVFRRLYLDAEILALKPGLIHFEFGTLSAKRMYLKKLLDCRVTVSFRGYDLNFAGLDQPNYYDDVWEDADALHLLGNDLWIRAISRGCPPGKKHYLIPPAIDTEFFTCDDRQYADIVSTNTRPLRIISVGRLEWKKGYDYALQAIKLIIGRGIYCEYRIIGAGNYLEAVVFARYQLRLEKEVTLKGAVTPSEVKESMLWADVFLHPSVSEGFCNAVIEAQAMGLPVVCTDADGLSENVADGETGFVVKRRNPEAMADKLALLAKDPALRQRMGIAGRKRVIEIFRIEKQGERFSDFYRTILDGKVECKG